MELRQCALQVLQLADPDQKSAAALALQAQLATYSIAEKFTPSPAEIGTLPGHPERPLLLRHTEMARRSPAYLLIGDDSALPAFETILASLSDTATVQVIMEVTGSAEERALPDAALTRHP